VSRPDRSYALGFEIVFVSIALAGGFAFLVYAINLFRSGERQASVFYYYVAALGIIMGAVFSGTLITGL
jgi:hypothetical protein